MQESKVALSLVTPFEELETHPLMVYIHLHCNHFTYQHWYDKQTGLYYRTFDTNEEGLPLDIEMGTKMFSSFEDLDMDFAECVLTTYKILTSN